MAAHPFVSVIVPTYRREQPLVTTLESLRALDYPAFEIIVVDQTAPHQPEVQQYLEKAEANKAIRWFRPPEIDFASVTKARNWGIKAAKQPEFIVFVDDDVEMEADFIHKHLAAYADSEVMATGGRIIVPGHSYPQSDPDRVAGVTWFGRFINNFYGKVAMDTDGFVGCNCSVRASILEKSGLFDERFMGNAMREETDVAVRIREVGGRIRYVPDALVIHHMAPAGGTRSESERRKWYQALFHNEFLFYGKHAARWRVPFFIVRMWRPMLVCWLWYGKGNPQSFLAPWRGIVSGLRAAADARREGSTVVAHPVHRIV